MLLAILLTACHQVSVEQQSNQPRQLQGQLLIWHPFQGDLATIFLNGLQKFQQLNPSVVLIAEYVPQNEISSRLIAQAKNGLGASLIIDYARQMLEMIEAEYIQLINEGTIDLSTYFAPTLTQVRYQGQIYGVPLNSQIRVLCYNQAKIKQASSSDQTLSQPPTRLEELIERSQKGYSVGLVSAFEDTFWGMGIFRAQFFDSQGLIKPQLEGWAKWLEWLKQANTQPNFILTRSRDILHKAFAQGKLTYYICNSSEIADLKNNLKDNLRVAPLPTEPERRATPILYTRVMILNRSASPDETHLALELTKFMTNPEQQIQGIVQSQSFIPTNQSVKINEDLFPTEKVLLEQAKTSVAIPLDELNRIMPVFEEGERLYQRVLAGNLDSSEAAKQLSEIVNQQIEQKEE
ncbi:ABC transporter substrate-binding protein [Chroococcus sp. FPU101]|uniref:sugar ABC transporter substrate-binding protein n=1 Tax=Chroococcus sp. FPU101 TaxID=1974212 RepID=UPI001A8C0187|nr:ABC transporter substrate-binding protein [Chroococcus sp. FPU101]GFE69138.1 extracellular solute-binding protein family 1 [Chroococcus sp. FPU101]